MFSEKSNANGDAHHRGTKIENKKICFNQICTSLVVLGISGTIVSFPKRPLMPMLYTKGGSSEYFVF